MNFNQQIAQTNARLKAEECLFHAAQNIHALTLDCSYLETEKMFSQESLTKL